MVTGVFSALQSSVQISRDQVFRRIGRCTDNDFDLILIEQLLGTLTHTACDNAITSGLVLRSEPTPPKRLRRPEATSQSSICSWKSCHFKNPFNKLCFSFTSLSIVLGLLFQPLQDFVERSKFSLSNYYSFVSPFLH